MKNFPFHAARLLKAVSHRLPNAARTSPRWRNSGLRELLALRISPIGELKMLGCVPSIAIMVLLCCPTSNGKKHPHSAQVPGNPAV